MLKTWGPQPRELSVSSMLTPEMEVRVGVLPSLSLLSLFLYLLLSLLSLSLSLSLPVSLFLSLFPPPSLSLALAARMGELSPRKDKCWYTLLLRL